MLSHHELIALSQELNDQQVLSVYLDAGFDDPALRTAWRPRLDNLVKTIRRTVESGSHAEKVAFERCVDMLGDELAPFGGGVGAPGWVGFITANGVRVADKVAAPMPTLAVWTAGVCIAPYVRALKQARPVIVIVADALGARLYRYEDGTLDLAHTMRADADIEIPEHTSDTARAGFHTGTRGETGRDAAQSAQRAATNRMLDEAKRQSLKLAGHEGWLLVAGIPEVGARLAGALRALAPERVLHVDGADSHATDAQVRAAAERGASQLRDEMDLRRVAEIAGETNDERLVARGPRATRRALDQATVRELYLTPRFMETHLADAEYSVRAAMRQNALVEAVARAAAERLDEYGGVGARLRFAP